MSIYAFSLEILVIKYYGFTIRKVNNKIDENFPKITYTRKSTLIFENQENTAITNIKILFYDYKNS